MNFESRQPETPPHKTPRGEPVARQFKGTRTVVIGAGPAGLTAAYELARYDCAPVVLEKGDKVGGLARTESYNGYHFDLGGHRFFTKAREVSAFWRQVLGDQLLRRPRLSRIYYRRRFFYYPLRPLDTLLKLGVVESARVLLSYLRWQVFPHRREDTFEQWVTNRFGYRLFRTFFKAYTEKVWGISCSELKAEWAAQRIKDLSVRSVLVNMFFKPRRQIKTLIEEFEYPRRGPGMMWNAVSAAVEGHGGSVRLNHDVRWINRTGNRIDSVTVTCNGTESVVSGPNFISSMPVSEFVQRLNPPAPPPVLEAAGQLKYRDFLTVCLIVNKPDIFPDNWIYVHDPSVRVGRIQNFKNWSPEMVPDGAKTSLGLEYFCAQGDELWNTPDAALVELARREIDRIGLARYEDVEDGCVVRVPNAYPVYDSDYRDHLALVRKFVDGLENLQTIGRNGLHRYNNQDHAMLTGMFAARNLALGTRHDLWSVNEEQEYHEEVYGDVPSEEVMAAVQRALAQGFARLDRVSFGIATGAIAGLTLWLATLWLVLRGGSVVGPNLRLLGQFFPGYDVTAVGSVIGLGYAAIAGFIAGWCFALLRNGTVFLWATIIQRRLERQFLRRLLDYV